MPVPYILDPFQRIIAFGRQILSYAYRATACPSGQGGASYERQTTTTSISTTGTQTVSTGSWEVYGGNCTVNTAPVELYLQPIGDFAPWTTGNIATWNYQTNPQGATGVNVTIRAVGWTIPGMPALQQSSMPEIFAETRINGTLVAKTNFNANRFYSLSPNPGSFDYPLIGAFNQASVQNQLPIFSLSGQRPSGNGGVFTVNSQAGDNGVTNFGPVTYTVSQGTVYTFETKITAPAYSNYTKYVYNQMLWA